MSERATRIQLGKLADALHVDAARIDYLEALDAEDLSELRDRLVATLHERYAVEYARLTRIGRLAPLRVAVPLATGVLPPRLLGRSLSAALLDNRTDRSMSMLSKIDPVAVADAAPFMNPKVMGEVAERADPELLGAVMDELLARKDFATADLFADYAAAMFMAPDSGVDLAVAPAPPQPRVRRITVLGRAFARRVREFVRRRQ
ncbi:hypothetical protein [Nocardia sp. NPDC057668]|uniref:hypothetical protein n=1 Tax=Nocardia sp. NPDC057668 TaxID=3346202 RepID=UPI0036724E15